MGKAKGYYQKTFIPVGSFKAKSIGELKRKVQEKEVDGWVFERFIYMYGWNALYGRIIVEDGDFCVTVVRI